MGESSYWSADRGPPVLVLLISMWLLQQVLSLTGISRICHAFFFLRCAVNVELYVWRKKYRDVFMTEGLRRPLVVPWVSSDYVGRDTLNSYHTAIAICRLCVILSRCHFLSSSLFPGTSIQANLDWQNPFITPISKRTFHLGKVTYLFHIIETIVMWHCVLA